MSEVVSYQIAVLAKEKGFRGGDHKSRYTFRNQEPLVDYLIYDEDGFNPDVYIVAPRQSEVQKWLREVHYLHVISYPSFVFYNTYIPIIFSDGTCIFEGVSNKSTYEEALEIGLYHALNLIK